MYAWMTECMVACVDDCMYGMWMPECIVACANKVRIESFSQFFNDTLCAHATMHAAIHAHTLPCKYSYKRMYD